MRITRYASALTVLALPLAACGADDKPIQRLGQQSAMTAETAPTSAPSTSAVTAEPEPQTVETTPITEPPTTEPAPVAVPRPVRTVPPTLPVQTTVPEATGEWAIPTYVVMCESGGSWTAQNASGAAGPYQLMPEHFGGESALNQTRAAQHAKAAYLWNGGVNTRSGLGPQNWKACL